MKRSLSTTGSQAKNAGAPTLSACRTTRWLLLLPLAGPSNFSLRTKIFLQLPKVRDHPVVMNQGPARTVLCRLYCDGVAYSGRARSIADSTFALYWTAIQGNVQTEFRRPITVVRKTELCRCGCGGRCTLDKIFAVITWSFQQLETGTWASAREDGTALDATRRSRAGQPLPLHGALVELACDMAELGHALGIKASNSIVAPCCKCKRAQPTIHDYVGEHEDRFHEDLLADAAASTIEKHLSAAEAMLVQEALAFQSTAEWATRGRILQRDVLDLRAGDRLEIGGVIRDLAQDLTRLTRYPARVCFWRARPQNFINWMCPIFRALRLENLAHDLLHTVDGGVAQYCAGTIFGVLIESGALGFQGSRANQVQGACSFLSPRLEAWYDEEAQMDASRTTLTPNVLLGAGGLQRPCVRAKAMESRWLFRYAAHELLQHMPALEAAGEPHASRARRLATAAVHLEAFYAEIHSWGPLMPEQAVQRVLAHTANHNALMRQVGCQLAPKHHWMWELCRHIRAHGNPRHNSCYPDESWNRITGRVARQVHPRTFAASVLQRLCIVIKAQWQHF